MKIPLELEQKIDALCAPYSQKELRKGAEELTHRYKNQKAHSTDLHRIVYLATRLPATYAVLKDVFSKIPLQKSVIDCGAGPGTLLWALEDPSIEFLLIEQDPHFVRLGKSIAPFAAEWKNASFLELRDRADLVLFSYSVNEIPREKILQTIQRAYEQTNNFLVIIEPGTPEGFERIRFIRTYLLSLGMSLHAPCPHHNDCPMVKQDWCHFAVRLARSSLHRALKEGSLGYEDEKYSYLIASKEPYNPSGARILRHPLKRKGHTYVTICTAEGLKEKILASKKGKKLKWGEQLSLE